MSYDVERLRGEIERLRAGEDLTPRDEACWPTPGQAWHELLAATETERLAQLGRLIDAASRASTPSPDERIDARMSHGDTYEQAHQARLASRRGHQCTPRGKK